MWDNGNGALADAPLPRVAPAATGRADTCATCDGPAPPGRLRCDACVNAEFDTLRVTYGEEGVARHAQTVAARGAEGRLALRRAPPRPPGTG
jgi:hypothetical protein